MSCTRGTRMHSTTVILRDDQLSLWMYDAAGIIHTRQVFSLIHDFEHFVAIIVSIARCMPEQLGVISPSIMTPPADGSPLPKDLVGYTVRLPTPKATSTVELTLTKPVFAQYALTGRRTFLYKAEMSDDTSRSKKKLIIKFSYQSSERQKEQDLIWDAHDAHVGHLPDVHYWGDLWKLSDGVRGKFRLKPGSKEDTAGVYENRTFRVIVYTEYDPVKPLFQKRCELIPVMVDQMIDCTYASPSASTCQVH